MDIRQYGPALFPTLKQTRRILDEEGNLPSHSRHDPSVNDADKLRIGGGSNKSGG